MNKDQFVKLNNEAAAKSAAASIPHGQHTSLQNSHQASVADAQSVQSSRPSRRGLASFNQPEVRPTIIYTGGASNAHREQQSLPEEALTAYALRQRPAGFKTDDGFALLGGFNANSFRQGSAVHNLGKAYPTKGLLDWSNVDLTDNNFFTKLSKSEKEALAACERFSIYALPVATEPQDPQWANRQINPVDMLQRTLTAAKHGALDYIPEEGYYPQYLTLSGEKITTSIASLQQCVGSFTTKFIAEMISCKHKNSDIAVFKLIAMEAFIIQKIENARGIGFWKALIEQFKSDCDFKKLSDDQIEDFDLQLLYNVVVKTSAHLCKADRLNDVAQDRPFHGPQHDYPEETEETEFEEEYNTMFERMGLNFNSLFTQLIKRDDFIVITSNIMHSASVFKLCPKTFAKYMQKAESGQKIIRTNLRWSDLFMSAVQKAMHISWVDVSSNAALTMLLMDSQFQFDGLSYAKMGQPILLPDYLSVLNAVNLAWLNREVQLPYTSHVKAPKTDQNKQAESYKSYQTIKDLSWASWQPMMANLFAYAAGQNMLNPMYVKHGDGVMSSTGYFFNKNNFFLSMDLGCLATDGGAYRGWLSMKDQTVWESEARAREYWVHPFTYGSVSKMTLKAQTSTRWSKDPSDLEENHALRLVQSRIHLVNRDEHAILISKVRTWALQLQACTIYAKIAKTYHQETFRLEGYNRITECVRLANKFHDVLDKEIVKIDPLLREEIDTQQFISVLDTASFKRPDGMTENVKSQLLTAFRDTHKGLRDLRKHKHSLKAAGTAAAIASVAAMIKNDETGVMEKKQVRVLLEKKSQDEELLDLEDGDESPEEDEDGESEEEDDQAIEEEEDDQAIEEDEEIEDSRTVAAQQDDPVVANLRIYDDPGNYAQQHTTILTEVANENLIEESKETVQSRIAAAADQSMTNTETVTVANISPIKQAVLQPKKQTSRQKKAALTRYTKQQAKLTKDKQLAILAQESGRQNTQLLARQSLDKKVGKERRPNQIRAEEDAENIAMSESSKRPPISMKSNEAESPTRKSKKSRKSAPVNPVPVNNFAATTNELFPQREMPASVEASVFGSEAMDIGVGVRTTTLGKPNRDQ